MAARVIAQQRWPYLASLLFSLKFVPVSHEELQTMGVDAGWRLYYSPNFVMNESPEALATVLLHEALHCMHAHADRFTSLHQEMDLHPIWNIAGDAGINEILDEAQMPWTTVEPVRFTTLLKYPIHSGMVTESIYFAILECADPSELDAFQDCGSGSGGASRTYELAADDPVNPSIRSDQRAGVRDRVAHDIYDHAKNRGTVPGGLLRWAESILHPTIDWREALAGKLRRDLAMVSGRRDYVYTRPSRRQEAMRLIGSTVLLPAMRKPAPPRVAVVVDTSGSISSSELQAFLGELVGITRASGVSGGIATIPCDARAYETLFVRSVADIENLKLPGGGGTDMSTGIRAASELRPKPHIIAVFTDGHTPWPKEAPRGIDSIIVISPTGSPPPPAWTHWIQLDDGMQNP
jgi:predicted metal-dependent peptidase